MQEQFSHAHTLFPLLATITLNFIHSYSTLCVYVSHQCTHSSVTHHSETTVSKNICLENNIKLVFRNVFFYGKCHEMFVPLGRIEEC